MGWEMFLTMRLMYAHGHIAQDGSQCGHLNDIKKGERAENLFLWTFLLIRSCLVENPFFFQHIEDNHGTNLVYCEKFELFMQSVVSDLPLLLRCISPENKQLVSPLPS